MRILQDCSLTGIPQFKRDLKPQPSKPLKATQSMIFSIKLRASENYIDTFKSLQTVYPSTSP